MATWKKVIVSGSNANLASVQVDNLISGQVVIGGGSGSILTTTAINGTGNIVATTGATGLSASGSFSGSFSGNIVTTLANVSKPNFVAYDVATGTFSYANTGSFMATSASYATSASAAVSASYASNATSAVSASYATSASAATSASYATNATTSSYAFNASASAVTDTTGAGTYFPTFVGGTSGNKGLLTDSTGFSYIGASNTITAGNLLFSGGMYASGAYAGPAFGDGIVVDYVTGNGRISVGAADAITFYNGGVGNTPIVSINTNGAITASYFSGSHIGNLTGTASYATSASYALTASYTPGSGTAVSSSYAASASVAVSASYASNATTAAQTANALSFGGGVSASVASFNGSAAVTTVLNNYQNFTNNTVQKWNGTNFINSNIVDTGTQVQIGAGASSGVNVAAGGINVTGNSTFNNDLSVTGNLTVAGTASFTNTDNLNIRDKFVLINSGSSTLADSGWITQYNAAGSGSAFYLEAASAGTYGRFAVAYDIVGTSTALNADEYVVTAKVNQSAPGAATPTWGGSGTNGQGNMWLTSTGDIYIWA